MRTNRITVQTVIVVGCVIFAVLMFCALILNLIKLATLSSQKAGLEAMIIKTDAQISQLESNVSQKSTEAFVDSYVREYLNMCGEDEIVFMGKK